MTTLTTYRLKCDTCGALSPDPGERGVTDQKADLSVQGWRFPRKPTNSQGTGDLCPTCNVAFVRPLFRKVLENDLAYEEGTITDAQMREAVEAVEAAGFGAALEQSAQHFTDGHWAPDEIAMFASLDERLDLFIVECQRKALMES